jgi:uncharacterized protein with gpF-like domain
MTNQQAFAQKVRQLIAQSKALTPAARKNILELLDEARKRIIAQLAGLNPSSFNAAQLNVLKHSIDQAMDQFAREAAIDVSTFQSQAASLGAQTASAPLAATGLEASAFGQVSRTTLAIAQGYSADLITAMSRDAALKINSTIQRAFLGGQQMTDIIDQLGRALNNGESTGLFGPIAERATSIATNEILRVHSIAAQARMSDLKERHPDLLKMWHHTPAARVPRMSHIAADGQVRDVNDPFDVDGEQLMFPRDPNGSAENTINCHCFAAPHFEDSALEPTDAQRGLLDRLGISVQVSPA